MTEPRFKSLEFTRYGGDEIVTRAKRFHAAMDMRRTTRHFSNDPVPREAIELAIRTAGIVHLGREARQRNGKQ